MAASQGQPSTLSQPCPDLPNPNPSGPVSLPPPAPACLRRYEGFIKRQGRQLASVAAKAAKRLPDDLDYMGIETLSMEAREKLSKCARQVWGVGVGVGAFRSARGARRAR